MESESDNGGGWKVNGEKVVWCVPTMKLDIVSRPMMIKHLESPLCRMDSLVACIAPVQRLNTIDKNTL